MSEHDDERELLGSAPEPPDDEVDEDEAEDDELRELTADEVEEHERQAEDALQRAHRDYLTAVLVHFGDEAPVMPCPTCESRGYVLTQLADDPQAERCDGCNGLGIVRTGSLVEGNVVRPCPVCHGAGFRAKTVEGAPLPVEPAAPTFDILPPEAFPLPAPTLPTLAQVG